jgi:5-methylthioadenosine/S-adenosylhomocysteine deaminase
MRASRCNACSSTSPNLFGGPEPDRTKLLTVRQVLEFATIEGAETNHLGHKIGTLTPGKEADVILLRTHAINVAPLNNAIGAIVLGMDSSNVDSVFIAGKAVKRNGHLVGVNVNRVLRQAQNAHDAVLQRAGGDAFGVRGLLGNLRRPPAQG